MSKPQEFILKLERKSLDDKFEIIEQTLPIDVVVPVSYFQKIAHQVNTHCKDMEAFIIKAFCKVETELAIRKIKVEQVFKITIEHMVNFNGVVLDNTHVVIDKP